MKSDSIGEASKRKAPRLKNVHPNAAGIDIGSQAHYVAVPEGRAEQSVRIFGCLTPDLREMATWLKSCGVETVAMESTGVYWVPIAEVLERYGLDVQLVDARHVKNVSGRKTDVADCQWLQQLHSYGLLRGAFRPDAEIGVLRTLWRHRQNLVEHVAQQTHRMHKALEQMNLQLHKVLSDVTGVTGMLILRAIAAGERDPVKLGQLKHARVKTSTDTIAQALTGNYRKDHLFVLCQALELYDVFQQKIADCDTQVEQHMASFESRSTPTTAPKTKQGARRKNQAHFDMRKELYRMTGVDLTRINGVEALTAQCIVSEIGVDMSRFPSEKCFASWLALCPNPQVTGGRTRRSKTRRSANRVAAALRVAAQSLHRSKSALGAFYRRMRARLGAPKAITAAAHKLAILVYRMLKHGEDFVDTGMLAYEDAYRARLLRNLQRNAKSLGFLLVPALVS